MTRKLPVLVALAFPFFFAGIVLAQDRPVLELSLQEAVQRALDNNVDIAVAKYDPESSMFSLKQAQGIYDPSLYSTLNRGSQTDPARNAFAGAETVDTKSWTYNFGLSLPVPTGANLRIDFNNGKQDTNNSFSSYNPIFNSSLTAQVTQPLLRNFRIDAAREQIKVAKKNKEISDVQFRQTVINTLANVRSQYYDYVYAIDNLEAQRKSLALAQKLLHENQIRVKVGTMAPLDVVTAESEVAARAVQVIQAESALGNAEDALKFSIFPRNDPELWALRLVPTDRPTAEQVAVDPEAAIKTALEKRTDIQAARKSLESANVQFQYQRNQLLPAVDLVASYGTVGAGGTKLERADPFGPVTNTIPGGYGDATSQVFGADYPTWVIGVNLSYPLFNRQARAASAQARVSRDQTAASLTRLELQIVTEVRSAARAVVDNYKSVEATRAARVLQEQRLDAEEKKFAAGMSTNFLVTQAQRDLAQAAVNELQAIANYRKALVNFDRVQESGVGGSSSSLTVSTGSYSGSSSMQ